MKSKILILILSISFVFSQTTLFICSDSTGAYYNPNNYPQQRGWGQFFQDHFDQNKLVVDNRSRGGRSTKNYLSEGIWDTVKSSFKSGDYVLIQFGHNDASSVAERHTDAGKDYDINLRRMANEAIQLGVTPVIMSCTAQRKWQNGEFVPVHQKYVESCKNVAAELGIHFVDVKAITNKLVKDMGENGSKKLYMISQGANDNTHFTIYGATAVAKLTADALIQEVPELAQYKKE